MKYTKLEQAVIELATPIADMELCYIYDVEYAKEAGVRFLRVFADKDGDDKITLDECEAISRKLSDLLDETELISDNYYLEVSSPGAARRLKTAKHFEMYIGEVVEVSLYKAINDTKHIKGKLVSYNDGEVTINVDGTSPNGHPENLPVADLAADHNDGLLTLDKSKYGKINLFFDINEILKNNKNM